MKHTFKNLNASTIYSKHNNLIKLYIYFGMNYEGEEIRVSEHVISVLDQIMTKNKKAWQDEDSMPPDESFREERFQSLKAAVEAGTYLIDNRILADSLLSHLLQEQCERLKKQ